MKKVSKKIPQKLGKFLDTLQAEKNLSDTQMGELLGMSRQNYYQLKHTRGNQIDILLKIKHLFKINNNKLIGRWEELD